MILIDKVRFIAVLEDNTEVTLSPKMVELLGYLSKDEYKTREQLNLLLAKTEYCSPGLCTVHLTRIKNLLGKDSIITTKYVGFKLASHVYFSKVEQKIEAVEFVKWLNYNGKIQGLHESEIEEQYKFFKNKEQIKPKQLTTFDRDGY